MRDIETLHTSHTHLLPYLVRKTKYCSSKSEDILLLTSSSLWEENVATVNVSGTVLENQIQISLKYIKFLLFEHHKELLT